MIKEWEIVNDLKYVVRKIEIKHDIVSFSKRKYKKAFGFVPNLENPKTFNEKTLWTSIFYHNPLYTLCADKIRVREYLEQKVGIEETERLLCKKYGYYEKPEEIDFSKLPDQFVLKSNHASGQVILCHDKSKLDLKKIKRTLRKWMKINYYYLIGEWQYLDIKPRIICEELLDSNIADYRIFCFEGKPTYIKVTKHSKSADGYDYNMYYPDWTETEFRMDQKYGKLEMQKPEQLDYMLGLAEKLSEDFSFVRVDFFTVENHVYFAELTFTPNSGREKYSDFEIDKRFGEMFKLPDDVFVKRGVK